MIKGLEEILKLCKVISEPVLLQSFGKIIVTMVPTPEEIIVSLKTTQHLVLESHHHTSSCVLHIAVAQRFSKALPGKAQFAAHS